LTLILASRAFTVPENLSTFPDPGADPFERLSRRTSEAQLVAGRRGPTRDGPRPVLYGRGGFPPPPPELCEDTLMSREHNDALSKLRFVSLLVSVTRDPRSAKRPGECTPLAPV